MWICSNCETSNEDVNSVCVVCGEKPAMKPHLSPTGSSFKWSHCQECGTMYYRNYSRFCHNCGKKRK